MDRLRFLRTHAPILALGFLLALVSSLGQTFFIGLFKESILAAHPSLTDESYGRWYAVATLSSAACLAYLGRRIDDVSLRAYAVAICLGLAGACALISFAGGVAGLVIALFGLRLFGQGLMSHTANTATARYVEAERGRALAVVNLGHPAGEALLPILLVLFFAPEEWRVVWRVAAIATLVCVIPLVLAVLRGHARRHAQWRARVDGEASGDDSQEGAAKDPSSASGSSEDREGESARRARRQWTAREVLFDRGFLAIVPALLTLPCVVTGLFFHQDVLRAEFGWSGETYAFGLGVYSITQVSSAPLVGAWVDRAGASRLLPLLPLPIALSLAAVAFLEGNASVFVMMVGGGLSSGIAFSVVGSVLAERYGTLHLGAIRSQLSVLMVISTALSPPLLGRAIVHGVSMRTVLLVCAVAGGTAGLLAAAVRSKAREPDLKE